MTVFDPFMPTPARTLAPKVPSQRIVPPPHVLPSCRTHQTWAIADLSNPGQPGDCLRCCDTLVIRERIIREANRRHLVGAMRADRYGK